ncbi:MAG: DUF5682 family protein [Janthinobacterium lividum]
MTPEGEGEDDRALLRAYGRRVVSGAGGVFHFPIRHHSPACALHLARALDEIGPRCIVIEMPVDFAPVLPLILDITTRPPVAVVAVADRPGGEDGPGGPAVTGYWPLSATAPEWAALQAAARLGARIVLADLPASRRLDPPAPATGPAPHAPPAGVPGDGPGGSVPDTGADATSGPRSSPGPGDGPEPGPTMLTDERPLAYSDYARGLVARLGARDFNEAWDRLFESRAAETDWRGFFADVGVHCALSRRTAAAADMAADGTLAREAHMRAALAAAMREGGPIAVVTGGFHTPALLDPDGLPDEAAPTAPKPADTPPIRPYLVRYSHANLDRINGYGAGMPSPRWYERLHDAVTSGVPDPAEAAATEVLLGLAARLRREQPSFAPPLPTLVTALRQARGLAELRGLPGPGRSELLDAARSCFVKDENPRVSPVLEMLHRELTGEGIGDVPRAAGAPPLVESVRARARALGFKVEDGQERRRDLDLYRKDRHRACSRFLHAMALLGTGFGGWVTGPDWTGGARAGSLLIETWTYAWSPQVEGRLAALSGDGGTLDAVALQVLRGRAAALQDTGQGRDAVAASRLVLLAAQAGMAAAQGSLTALLAGAVASDPDPVRIVRCLGVLDGLWGGQRVLGLTGSAVLGPLRAACYRRAIDLLPNLATVRLDRLRDAAGALAGLHHILEAADLAGPAAAGPPLDRELFDEGVAALLGGDLPPLIAGVVGALAHLSGRLDAAGLAALVCGALAGAAADAADRVAPLAGLVLVQPALLRRCAPLLDGMDAAFGAIPERAFLQVLPHLRLALTALDPHETDDLAARVAAMKGISRPLLHGTGDFTEAEVLANAARSQDLAALLAADGLEGWHG